WTSYPIQSGVVLKVKDFINGEITGKNMKFRILEVDPSANVTCNVVCPGVLTKPSGELASTVNGLAAINGSFFDGTTGLAQTYLRINGTKINGDGLTGGEADNKNRAGGSVVVDASGTPTIQLKPTPYVTDWQDAIQGQDVLSGGPVLLLDRKKVVFSPSSYNTETSYRRTVIAKKMDGTTVLLAIEGSNSCFDLQQLVYALGYKDAINLDGGGSTMMVIKDRGLVITPTDADGERSVSNMLILKSK
ncbi:MAG: phosphodiester glycosidase family protein, partial [Dysgonamonadaceae bacterium]|nr:phosphodiester glycosidase family protein [Dysgonamonadaceae bacterium]